MIPDGFDNFFVASAGVSGALIGLLFVATALAPERIVARSAPAIARETASGAFIVLSNTMFVSLSALIPSDELYVVACIAAIAGMFGTLMFAGVSLSNRKDGGVGPRWLIRRVTTLAVLVWELVTAIQLSRDPTSASAVSSIAIICLVFLLIGLSRAWQLLGGEGHGILDMVANWRAERDARSERRGP